MITEANGDAAADPRRWLTLAIVIMSVLILVLDNTVLTVAIPTILREFHTTLPSLQWVITGYSLTFATLLIIGGRLGDIYGARRTFIIGASLFGLGSLLASLAHSVPQLLVGEAFIEGIGAALMMPNTLAILSNTFRGRERATAFAAWGAIAGAGVAFGPIVGGYLTTYHSWRWAFLINVIVTPIAVVGAVLFIRKDPPGSQERLDIPGAALIALGTFSLVFGISQAGAYGWLTPLTDVTLLGHVVWPSDRSISIIPIVFLVAFVLLAAFVRVEQAKERSDRAPLFEFGQLRHKCFRYGLLTSLVLAMGQLGMLFVLPVFLQEGKHLSAVQNGLWLVPMGVCILVAAQVGGRLTRIIGTTTIVRAGLVIDASGLVLMGISLRPGVTLPGLLPALVLFGTGVGLASSQLTNVILYDVDPDKAGVASGANSTVRQVGSALGVAIIGSILSTQTIRHAVRAVKGAGLAPAAEARALQQVHAQGVSFAGVRGTSAPLARALESAVAAASRPSLLIAAGIVVVGALLSFLIPPVDQRLLPAGEERLDLYDIAEPVDTHMAR
jgi:EmrB/QacA subfamily drug resistance transporter